MQSSFPCTGLRHNRRRKIMTMITFSNDAQRKNFQVEMAITALQLEVQTGLKMCRIPVMNVLRRHYPDLPRNKKTALKWLKENGPKKN
jgi:hypothetical protein